jgi:hypothetical protein
LCRVFGFGEFSLKSKDGRLFRKGFWGNLPENKDCLFRYGLLFEGFWGIFPEKAPTGLNGFWFILRRPHAGFLVAFSFVVASLEGQPKRKHLFL